MKRCPNCNRTFEEDWLAFCTQDGTTLIDESPAKKDDLQATMLAPAPPPPAGGWQQPSGGLGSGQFPSQPIAPPPAPSSGFGSGQFQPAQQMQSGWQPPPPPPYAAGPKQGLAVASMICGIGSITIGWCCYLGTLSAPVALGLGIYQLVQIKNKPEEFGGKPFAIVGVATGAVYFLGILVIILIYGAAILMGGIK
jgi:hypothetical protein